MKNKLIIALLIAAMAVSVTACGKSDKDTTEAIEQTSDAKRSGEYDLDLSKIVTEIPDYSKIELDIDSQHEITDEASNEYLTNAILQFGGDAYKENKDRDVVEKGDYVKVDYTGYKDDKAFDGGAATDVLLDIANNKQVGQETGFIEGFCDGIEGAKVGETIKCPVTFPENYGSEELAGQAVIFEFKIKGIYTTDPVTLDDLSDEDVNNIFGKAKVTSKEELRKQIKADLENKLYSAEVTAVKKYMIENSKVDIPEDYFEARFNEYIDSLEKDYASGTQTLKDVVEATGSGTSYDEFVEMWKEELTNQIKIEMIFGRIAEIEEIELDDEGFSSYISYVIQQSNSSFADEKAAYEYFGAGNADEGEAYMKNQYLVNKAVDVAAANVTPKFVDKTQEDETESADGTESVEETETK